MQMRINCKRTCKYLTEFLRPLILWLCGWVGITVLPTGFSMFSDEMAKEIGVEQAIVYQKVSGWIRHNERHASKTHYKDGT